MRNDWHGIDIFYLFLLFFFVSLSCLISSAVVSFGCRTGTASTTSSGGATTPAPAPALPTYQRSQAALRGPASQQPQQSQQQQQHSNQAMNSSGNNSVGPFLASPASVAPSPLPTPHSHAPPSVPPMGKLTLSVGIDCCTLSHALCLTNNRFVSSYVESSSTGIK